jgi:hypothetical protein
VDEQATTDEPTYATRQGPPNSAQVWYDAEGNEHTTELGADGAFTPTTLAEQDFAISQGWTAEGEQPAIPMPAPQVVEPQQPAEPEGVESGDATTE